MARVIKKGGTKITEGLSPPSRQHIMQRAGRRVIEKEVFAAQQEAAKLLMDAEVRRTQLLDKAEKQVEIIRAERMQALDRSRQVEEAKALLQSILWVREQKLQIHLEMEELSWSIFEKISGERFDVAQSAIEIEKTELSDFLMRHATWQLSMSSSDIERLEVEMPGWLAAVQRDIPELRIDTAAGMPSDMVEVRAFLLKRSAPLDPILRYLNAWLSGDISELSASNLPTLEGDSIEEVSEISEVKAAQGLRRDLEENMYNENPDYDIGVE